MSTSPEQSEQLATSDVPETTIEQSIFAYEEFLAEQQQREHDWEAARAAKRAKTTDTCSTPTTPAPVAVAPVAVAPVAEEQSIQDNEVGRLTKQLGEKNKECERLKREVQELKESSRKEAEKQLTVTENFYKIIERVEDAIESMDCRMTAALQRIEQRLVYVETVSTNDVTIPFVEVSSNASSDNCLSNKVSTEDMSSANLVAKEADLSTIDVEALNDIRREVFPISPTPLSSAVPHSPVAESPVSLSPVVPHSPVVESTGLVSEELIRSCVTPRKVKKVQDTLQAEHDRYRCAVKLLPHFFSKEELRTCNTDGTHNKVPLDRTRLHSLKVLLFTKFPVRSDEDEDKCWRFVKGKINVKCRHHKFTSLSCDTTDKRAV